MLRALASAMGAAVCSTSGSSALGLAAVKEALPACASLVQLRTATKKASGGSRNVKGKNNAPKSWGPKMGDGQLIFPGQIIFRQRGYRCRPGFNVTAGRDATLHSSIVGFVRYHREKVAVGKEEKEKVFVSVEPVGGDWSPEYAAKQAEMVERRSFIKRLMLGRRRLREPALYFPNPDRRPPHIIKREQAAAEAAATAALQLQASGPPAPSLYASPFRN